MSTTTTTKSFLCRIRLANEGEFLVSDTSIGGNDYFHEFQNKPSTLAGIILSTSMTMYRFKTDTIPYVMQLNDGVQPETVSSLVSGTRIQNFISREYNEEILESISAHMDVGFKDGFFQKTSHDNPCDSQYIDRFKTEPHLLIDIEPFRVYVRSVHGKWCSYGCAVSLLSFAFWGLDLVPDRGLDGELEHLRSLIGQKVLKDVNDEIVMVKKKAEPEQRS
ncbi:hypothetical protein HDU76_008216 [Blyttiomyces sp. JEL0837]|nr:hypothetical protein HDU76_008216 [Blyttiomyces sp. JEL0837]